MARYEVAVDASFELAPPRVAGRWHESPSLTEPVTVWFQGRKFIWHPGGRETYSVVTTVVEDSSNYRAEELAMERFLSALAYPNHEARVLAELVSGYESEGDAPTWKHLRRPPFIRRVAPEIVVEADENLARCLALLREGNSSHSDALRLLSYWKVVEMAVGRKRFEAWVSDQTEALQEVWLRNGSEPQTNWFAYIILRALLQHTRSRKGTTLSR